MSKGYYCLVQYCPDFSRAEAANVGLVLFQAEPATTAVRMAGKVGYVAKRLGVKLAESAVRDDVQSFYYRLRHEQFRSVEDLEQFARTRGNQLQVTLPRPMRIEAIERDADVLFRELVENVPDVNVAAAARDEVQLLRQTFLRLAERMPDSVYIDREFRIRDRDISLQPKFAYRNGRLNLVEEVSIARSHRAMFRDATWLSREGQLAHELEEGPARLFVVASAAPKGTEQESAFGALLGKLGAVDFIASSDVQDFTKRIEAELAQH